jgi:hypothetical protein
MKNTRLIKVIPQILLLSLFALSSCGNESPDINKCLAKLKTNLEAYQKELPKTNSTDKIDDNAWSPDSRKLPKTDEIAECKSSSGDPNYSKYTQTYEQIYSDLETYKKLASNYDSDDSSTDKLKQALKLKPDDISTGTQKKIVNHKGFIDYASTAVGKEVKVIQSNLSGKPTDPVADVDKRLKALEELKIKEEIDGIKKDLSALKSSVAANSLFNLLVLTGILGSLGYFIFSKINTNKPDSLADKKRKSRSGKLGDASPQNPANQGYGNPAPSSGKGLSGGRGMGANRPTRNSPTNLDEDFDERQSGYHEPDSDVGYQQQQGLKSRLNKPAQNREYTDPRDIEQQDFSDRSSSNINPPSPRDNYGQTYLPQARVNRVQLTENLAIQSYQSKSYSSLEASTVGYYSATPESVTRNRADWANPLDLVEFFDGLFWIVKASERNLLFPNPRMRIEQTRIRGIEYFFETNYSDENYHSCTLDTPAYVEFVNGKWVRIKKGRVTFAY